MRIPPVLRVMLRIGLGLLVAVPALTLILIGGGLLFLRSDTGERWVERVAAEHLPPRLRGPAFPSTLAGSPGRSRNSCG